MTDTPFTQLMVMGEGSRHDHIFSRCSYFALSNGFEKKEFKTLIRMIHDEFLVKIGPAMSESELFTDLDKRWEKYKEDLKKYGYVYDPATRVWAKRKTERIDERRSADWLFEQVEFYGQNRRADGTFEYLVFKEKGGPYEYKRDITSIRKKLRDYSEQNFIEKYNKEVEVQLMQMCAEQNRCIIRNDKYIIVKNKVLSCISPDAYDFSWIGKRPPTDVVLPWTWYPEEWVEEHKKDLGAGITRFIQQLSRNSRGVPQSEVEQWLWVIAGASMIPANQLQKIVILSGGGQNGKSLYTSLIRLCLGADMFNESKILDSDPHDSKFWGEGLDKGILCVIDDVNRLYNKDALSYIKGAITGTDTVVINEKFKSKRVLDILPQIIACTNFEFELYDKSEGMRRRVKILPTEYHIEDSVKDTDLQHKLVLNTTDVAAVARYKMSEDAFSHRGVKVMNMYTEEKGVIDSLTNGSLAWFANKARYMYMQWLVKELVIGDTIDMIERMDLAFSGGFNSEIVEFLQWYLEERKKSIWIKDLYTEYLDWHTEVGSGEMLMKDRQFSIRIFKAIRIMQDKGHKLDIRKARNDKGMILNKLFIGDEIDE